MFNISSAAKNYYQNNYKYHYTISIIYYNGLESIKNKP